MIDNNIINESVTNDSPIAIDIDGILRELAREQPVTAPAELAQWRGQDTMPAAYRRHLERLAAKRERARKRRGMPARRRRGRFHWKNKEKTRLRRKEKMWREAPFECILNMNDYKCKSLDRHVWDTWAAPLWREYEPTDLYVRFPKRSGTRRQPWSMFNIKIFHKEKGLLLDGESLELFILSGGG